MIIHNDPENLIFAVTYIFLGILQILLCLPLLKRRIPMNKWYGFRFQRSFQSEELWYAINEYGAQRMIIWSFALIGIGAGALALPLHQNEYLCGVIALTLFVVIIPAVETYIYSRKLEA